MYDKDRSGNLTVSEIMKGLNTTSDEHYSVVTVCFLFFFSFCERKEENENIFPYLFLHFLKKKQKKNTVLCVFFYLMLFI